MIVLGIETSCDETSVAVLNDSQILSNVVLSQTDIHEKYNGVVPELASRAHLEMIDKVVLKSLFDAKLSLHEIQGVAVTHKPGLVGALLVGLCFGKAISFQHKIPFIGVNHLEGHLYSPFLTYPELSYPYLGLVVSGGHSNLYHVKGFNCYELIGRTRDDAAGEAFDKVATLLGLGYPGGVFIEKIASKGNEQEMQFPIPMASSLGFDFSFSGLKTAVIKVIDQCKRENRFNEEVKAHIAASFQYAVVQQLVLKTIRAKLKFRSDVLAISGGVACNSRLRQEFSAKVSDSRLYFADRVYCTDNAAMIAYVGMQYLKQGIQSDYYLNAYAR